MYGLFGSKTEEAPKTFGVNLPGDNRVAAVELKAIADKYKERTAQIDKHLNKAAKDKAVADKLAAAYIHNYTVMVDISNLLNQYADFFASIKEVLNQSDTQLERLNASHFSNLEKLTRAETDKFTSSFAQQVEKVKSLFLKYNMTDQAAKLSSIPGMTGDVNRAAEEAIVAGKSGGRAKKHIKKQAVKQSNGRKKEKGAKAT